MRNIILFILALLVIPAVLATPSFYYRQNDVVDIKLPCTNDGAPCSDSSNCNISISYPNSSVYISQANMTNNLVYYNYTLTDSSVVGEYQIVVFCIDGVENGYSTFTFMITENGYEMNDWTFILGLGLIVFLLFYFGFKITNPEHLFIQLACVSFGVIFSLMIPAFFFLRNIRSLFYKTFMGFMIVFAIYIVIYMSYYALKQANFLNNGRRRR